MRSMFLTLATLLTIVSSYGQWVQFDTDLMGMSNSSYGTGIELSGDGSILVIGASTDSSVFSEGGMAQVFTKSGDIWVQLGQDLFGSATEGYFGQSVAINRAGARIAVGQPYSNPPLARVYEFDGSAWVQLGADLTNNLIQSEFGLDLDLNDSGDKIVVGAPSYYDGGESQLGRAYVYQWDGASWNLQGAQETGNKRDVFAWRVVMDGSGDVFAAGTLGGSPDNLGYAKIFEWNGSAWEQKGQTLTGFENGDGYGSHIEISKDGNTFVGTAPYPDDLNGSAVVYNFSSNTWQQVGDVLVDDLPETRFGFNPTLNRDADILMIGSIGTSDAGEISFFRLNGGSWSIYPDNIEGNPDDRLSEPALAMDDSGSFVAGTGYGPTFLDWYVGAYSNPTILDVASIKEGRLSLYPNPNNGSFRLSGVELNDIKSIEVYNALGARIMHSTQVDNSGLFRIPSSRGLYLVKVTTSEGSYTTKMLVR